MSSRANEFSSQGRRGRSRSPSRDRYRDHDERRNRSRSRSRSRERNRERDDVGRSKRPDRRSHSRSRSRSRSPVRRRSRSRERERDRKRGRSRSKSKSRSRSRSRSPSYERSKGKEKRRRSRSRSSSPDSSASEDRRRHKKRKDKHKKKRSRSRDRKERKKEKKEKKKKKASASSHHWGKYGIINETDLFTKEQEFRSWLVEERKINPETTTKEQTRKEFAKFVEDYNTATLPHEKFYNMQDYERRMDALRSGAYVPPANDGYDPDADMRALQSTHKRKAADTETYLSRDQLLELRKVQAERIEAGKMKLLGMDIKQTMGVRMDGSSFE